jgi:hypothetical protein
MHPTTLGIFLTLTAALCSSVLNPRVNMRISIVAQLIPGKGGRRPFEIEDPAGGILKCCVSVQLVGAKA